MSGPGRSLSVTLLNGSKLLSVFMLLATLLLVGCGGGSKGEDPITSNVCTLGASTIGDCVLGSQ